MSPQKRPRSSLREFGIFVDNRLGLDTKSSVFTISPEALTEARNVDYDRRGGRNKRRGESVQNSASIGGTVECTGLFNPVFADGTNEHLSTWTDGTIRKLSSGAWNTVTGGTGFSTIVDVFWTAAMWKDQLVMMNGRDAPQVYTTAAGMAALTLGRLSATAYAPVVHRNRMWAIQELGGNSVVHSALDSLDFAVGTSGTGTQPIDDGDGDEIIGFAPFLNAIFVFKERSIHTVTGTQPSTFAIDPNILYDNIGAVHHRAIAIVTEPGNVGIYFCGFDDVWRLVPTDAFGDFRLEKLTQGIEDEYSNNASLSRRRLQCMEWYGRRNQLWIGMSTLGATQNDLVLKLTVEDELKWATMDGGNVAVNAIGIRLDESDNTFKLYTGNDGGQTFQQDSGLNDAGSGYTASVRWPHLHFGEPHLIKEFRKIMVFVDAQGSIPLSFALEVDFSTTIEETMTMTGAGTVLGSFELDVDTLAGEGEVISIILDLEGSGRFMRPRFFNSTADQDFNIFGFVVEYKIAGTEI